MPDAIAHEIVMLTIEPEDGPPFDECRVRCSCGHAYGFHYSHDARDHMGLDPLWRCVLDTFVAHCAEEGYRIFAPHWNRASGRAATINRIIERTKEAARAG